LEKRIKSWLDLNLDIELIDLDPGRPDKFIVGVQKEPLPLSFNVEVGAYINVLRSSLDILATAIAIRYGVPNAEKVYFPVASGGAQFEAGNFKGAEFIKLLPPTPRQIIEALKPYKGGNGDLWRLHQLDIMRKHRKLLTIATDNRYFQIIGSGFQGYYSPLAAGSIPIRDNKTVFGFIRRGAPNYEMKYAGQVSINEAEPFVRKPVVTALYEFSNFAKFVIEQFDIT